jgi:NADPH:quinone reductase-like Zn-dependent oxidoreductase
VVDERATTLNKDRFDITGCKMTMKAVVTMGNGGYEQLVYRDVPIPEPSSGEVLLQVLAAGVNNTDINTRLGWYSSAVTTGTQAVTASEKEKARAQADGGWNEPTPFPFVQGTDCCGRVVAVGPGGDESTLGLRVLVRPCIRPDGFESFLQRRVVGS